MRSYNRRSHDLVWSAIERLSFRSSFVAKSLEITGHVASYAMWMRARGIDPTKHYRGRESLWRSVFPELASGPVTVFEFGVSWGAATRFWLDHVSNPDLVWHGFDTFSGLPTPWTRGGIEFAARGTFDADNRPPRIDDKRVTWHVGLIAETLPRVAVAEDTRICALFDLDLYEPSAFALQWLEGKLRPGDLLYFDEAYDPWHERRLLDDFLGRGHRVRHLGTTGMALMLEYEGPP
jgi:hypothetical protein